MANLHQGSASWLNAGVAGTVFIVFVAWLGVLQHEKSDLQTKAAVYAAELKNCMIGLAAIIEKSNQLATKVELYSMPASWRARAPCAPLASAPTRLG
jgi:hypothetical protein